jgi:N-acetylglutamate synthase-like GNAT family acetyltransferase
MTTADAKLAAGFSLRQADSDDLGNINDIIAAAMDTWDLAERVKRISLPLYRYQSHDLVHLQILIAESNASGIVGVAALEQAPTSDLPGAQSTSVLHGLYVEPSYHGKGVGSLLLKRIEEIAALTDARGLLVKAQHDAVGFFVHLGFKTLPVEDDSRDYPYRLWKRFS